jgi:Skp family chaperone for outer membrane proteins
MKFLAKLIFLSSLLILTACLEPAEPRIFGVNQSMWYQLTPRQQEIAMENFYANQRHRNELAQKRKEAEVKQAEQDAMWGSVNNIIDTIGKTPKMKP